MAVRTQRMQARRGRFQLFGLLTMKGRSCGAPQVVGSGRPQSFIREVPTPAETDSLLRRPRNEGLEPGDSAVVRIEVTA